MSLRLLDRRDLLATLLAAGAATALGARAATPAGLPPVQVFKNPSCGCCGAWVAHLRGAGFQVQVNEVADTTVVRRRVGMPDRFGSCHTATVAGYAIEGHVPAEEIRRLLAARPAAVGLAVPSMPPGSPGMEVGDRHDPYDVLLVDRQGGATVFAHYPKA